MLVEDGQIQILGKIEGGKGTVVGYDGNLKAEVLGGVKKESVFAPIKWGDSLA